MENLVGSQKRKARKTKITHLVRTADGSVSPVEGGWWTMVSVVMIVIFVLLPLTALARRASFIFGLLLEILSHTTCASICANS